MVSSKLEYIGMSEFDGTIPIYIISFNLLSWTREPAERFDDVSGKEKKSSANYKPKVAITDQKRRTGLFAAACWQRDSWKVDSEVSVVVLRCQFQACETR